MAGSLERPNRERWSKVAHASLTFSGTLIILCGVSGYLGFLEKTDGNILFNMEGLQSLLMVQLNKVAQAMLLMCMFFVYPMDCFVLRHVAMVLLFKGRVAHGGFDHLVLARSDRRILLTFVLYMLSLLPALLLQNLGAVLSITGSVAGSALSYICPGASYLAVHGAEFKKLVNKNWVWGNPDPKAAVFQQLKRLEDRFSAQSIHESGQPADADTELPGYDLGAEDNIASTSHTHQVTKFVQFIIGRGTWYFCLMPVWMTIAEYGQRNLLDYAEKEATESPLPAKPLGKIARRRSLTDIARGIHTPDFIEVLVAKGIVGAPSTEVSPLLQANFYAQQLKPKSMSIPDLFIFSHDGSLKLFGKESKGAADPSALLKPTMSSSGRTYQTEADLEGCEEEDDPQSDFPKLKDFLLAAAFISIGVVAMVAGLCSVIVPTN
jgi:sodium-coupled neutral amino acid transporter 11